jgi:hypothetical protein
MADYRINKEWVIVYTIDNNLIYGPLYFDYAFMQTRNIVFTADSLAACQDEIAALGLTHIRVLSPRVLALRAAALSAAEALSAQNIEVPPLTAV